MDIFLYFQMSKYNVWHANGVGGVTTSNTPAFVVNAGIQTFSPLNMDARLVSGTGIILILIILTPLMDHSSVGGTS